MLQASDSRRLTACVVNLNWSEQELKDNCGPPDQVVAWAGHGIDRCALYRTSARSFVMGTGVEVIAACLHTTKGFGTNPDATRVAEIFGLDSSILPER
jgi:hypothetical protein